MFSHRTLAQSFKYSFEGVYSAVRDNQNMRIHIGCAIAVLFFAFILGVSGLGIGILVAMIVLVLVAEMLNTAVEEVVDLIVTEHRRQAKIAKDVASGMVLIAATGSVVVGALIFFPYIFRLFY